MKSENEKVAYKVLEIVATAGVSYVSSALLTNLSGGIPPGLPQKLLHYVGNYAVSSVVGSRVSNLFVDDTKLQIEELTRKILED